MTVDLYLLNIVQTIILKSEPIFVQKN